MLKIVCFAGTFAFFLLLFSNDESKTIGFGSELGTEMRTHSALSLSCSILYPVAFFCAVLSCLDKCLALRRRKWSCPNLEFSLPRTNHFTLQIQGYNYNNRIWKKWMDCWWYYVKLNCVTCGIVYSLSLLITPILKVKIK
jgi:hypothetical protein